MFHRGPNFLCSKCKSSYKNFFSRQLVFRKTFSGEIVGILTSHPKIFFFWNFQLNCKIYVFFSKEFIFAKMSVWTCTIQFWHHCDNLFAQFANFIVTLYLLQLNSFAATTSRELVRMQFWQLYRQSPGIDGIILIHSDT